jgi:hypothetical protein
MTATEVISDRSNKTIFVDVTIAGISPLLMHAISPALLFPANGASGGKTGKARSVFGGEEEDPREQARLCLYTDADGKPALPVENLFKAIVEAGRFHKMGRRQVTTRDTSLVPAGLGIEGAIFPIRPGTWEVHSRMVTNQTTAGKIPSHRPRFDQWELDFVLRVDTDLFPVVLVRKLVDDAGSKLGVGSFRPERKGPFGRFVVVRWDQRS